MESFIRKLEPSSSAWKAVADFGFYTIFFCKMARLWLVENQRLATSTAK